METSCRVGTEFIANESNLAMAQRSGILANGDRILTKLGHSLALPTSGAIEKHCPSHRQQESLLLLVQGLLVQVPCDGTWYKHVFAPFLLEKSSSSSAPSVGLTIWALVNIVDCWINDCDGYCCVIGSRCSTSVVLTR